MQKVQTNWQTGKVQSATSQTLKCSPLGEGNYTYTRVHKTANFIGPLHCLPHCHMHLFQLHLKLLYL